LSNDIDALFGGPSNNQIGRTETDDEADFDEEDEFGEEESKM